MREDSKPLEPQNEVVPVISNRRILWITALVLIIAIGYSAFFAERRDTLGLIIGGGLLFANYFWLEASLKDFFEKIAGTGSGGFLMFKFAFRYLAMGAVLAAVYYSGIASVITTLLGFGAIAAGILIEGFIRIFFVIFKRTET